jgi:bifunctional non-homologous end joining protein LigD
MVDALSKIGFTDINKVFFPAIARNGNLLPDLTKKDLIEYYQKVAKYILPHLRDRPLFVRRYPNGILGKSFFVKNWTLPRPAFADSVKVYSVTREEGIRCIICNNEETLLWLVNLGCIEMHPWHSRVWDDKSYREEPQEERRELNATNFSLKRSVHGLSSPDYVVFDLDPHIYSEGEETNLEHGYCKTAFDSSVEVAFDLKDLLGSYKTRAYVKTSGRNGLHVYVPIARAHTFDDTKRFAEFVARLMLIRNRNKIALQWTKAEREGKVFFDYNQNEQGKTMVSALSARPSDLATVSMPLKWSKLHEAEPIDFTIVNVPSILESEIDSWSEILQHRQDLNRILFGSAGA